MENESDESAGAGSRNRAGVVRASYDWSSTPPLVAVVETVSAAVGRDVNGTDPLHEAVDPDALDSLVRGRDAGGCDAEVSVSFAYSGQLVTVRGDGDVVVRPDSLAGPGDE